MLRLSRPPRPSVIFPALQGNMSGALVCSATHWGCGELGFRGDIYLSAPSTSDFRGFLALCLWTCPRLGHLWTRAARLGPLVLRTQAGVLLSW